MKRFSEQYLVQWIKTWRRKPLILRGARQVGKSTLVRQFANQQNLLLNVKGKGDAGKKIS